MIDTREERMNDGMVKWHIGGMPFAAVLHQFTQPDHGDFHDHPWSFQSTILHGVYVEEVLRLDGTTCIETHGPGDSFHVSAGHMHRIIELPQGECWTIIVPGLHERKSGFYQRRHDGLYHRFHDQREFERLGV